MNNFFINSSEILLISLLNNKTFYFFSQDDLAKCIGCTQPNISYVLSSLQEKEIVINANGFLVVNQRVLIKKLVEYAVSVYTDAEIDFSNDTLVIKYDYWDACSFFKSYFRIFNINYFFTQGMSEVLFSVRTDT